MADLTQQSKATTQKPYDPMQEVTKKVVSSLGEFRSQQAIEAAQAGKTDQEIISTLMQLAGTTYQKPTGDTAGLFGPMFGYKMGDAITKPEQLGMTNAAMMMKLPGDMRTQGLQEEKLQGDIKQQPFQQTKLEQEAIQAPMQTQKLQTDIAASKQGLRQKDPNFQINMRVREKAATDFAELSPKVVQTANILNQIAEVMPRLGEYETTLLGQMGGRTKAFTETFSKNPDFVKFDRMVNKVLPGLARTFGDTGVLNDKDIIRWQKVLGDKTATIASKIEAINELMSDAKIGMQERMDMAGIKPTPQLQKFVMDFQPIQLNSQNKSNLPLRSEAPKGATGWDTEKGQWV